MGHFVFHLLAIMVKDLDAVIVEDVMGGGDHDTAVEVLASSDIRNAWGGCDVKDIGVCTARGDTSA